MYHQTGPGNKPAFLFLLLACPRRSCQPARLCRLTVNSRINLTADASLNLTTLVRYLLGGEIFPSGNHEEWMVMSDDILSLSLSLLSLSFFVITSISSNSNGDKDDSVVPTLP